MPNVPTVRATMDESARTLFVSDLVDILTLIPWAQAPSADMIQGMPKWGTKSENFVDIAYDNAKARPDILSASFKMSDFEMDMTLVRQLRIIMPKVEELYKKMTGTIMILQSQVMSKATLFYNLVRESYEGGEGDLEIMYHQLKERFPGVRSEEAPEETPENTPAQ